jgi:hypothetical protein
MNCLGPVDDQNTGILSFNRPGPHRVSACSKCGVSRCIRERCLDCSQDSDSPAGAASNGEPIAIASANLTRIVTPNLG